MSTFTIKSTMPTGKTHEKFGSEFYVQFGEVEQAYPLWFKKVPEVGSTIEGDVVDGKFKKAKKEWNPQANPQSSGNATTPTAPSARPAYKDNSVGMRIGMCINNAANYVNSLEFPKALTDREWAETVIAYASALYPLSDLESPQTAPEKPTDPMDNVKAVFGISDGAS